VIAIASLLFIETFSAVSFIPTRVLVSVATAIFIILCASAAGALFSAAYFFLRMVNSPKPGKTIFDAHMLKGNSVLSDRYLNDEGRVARAHLLRALRWFGVCWLGGLCIGLLAGWLVRIA
jgi:hypothetical protein